MIDLSLYTNPPTKETLQDYPTGDRANCNGRGELYAYLNATLSYQSNYAVLVLSLEISRTFSTYIR